jgi:hypothetical protein
MNSDVIEFDKFIHATQQFFSCIKGQMIFIVNVDLTICYASSSFIALSELEVGHVFNDATILKRSSLNFDFVLIEKHLRAVFSDKVKRLILCPITKNGVAKIASFTIGCVVNPRTENAIGAIVYLQRFNLIDKLDIVSTFYHQNITESAIISDESQLTTTKISLKNVLLTKREENVIFLLLQKYSSREIAEILTKVDKNSITKDAIDKLITNQL